MSEPWMKLLPDKYRDSIIKPVAFEHHHEPSVQADKIIGYDVIGARCFYLHSFVLSEEGFDAEEFPIEKMVYFEQVVAWKAKHGRWIKLKRYSDKLEGCNKKVITLPPEIIDNMPR